MKNTITRVLQGIECLTIYREVFNEPVLCEFRDLLRLVGIDDAFAPGKYYNMLGSLIGVCREHSLPGIDIFKNHILDSILKIENSFSRSCEKAPFEDVDDLIIAAVQNDLRLLKAVYDFDLLELKSYLDSAYRTGELAPAFRGLIAAVSDGRRYPEYYFEKLAGIKAALAASANWSENVRDLHAFYREAGSGKFGRFWAFRWNGRSLTPGLSGIANPDSIQLGDLVGCDNQKEDIILNTRQFLKGISANNVLLYGDRGTGKSSTVKSLIHVFGPEGLRIVEVSKHDLLSLNQIVAAIEGRAQKFIIFIDDLSFEEDETEYKDLKALLEGSISRPPENVLVYATSNRRNLVREFFGDRETDEVGKQDTYQEKLSLADRFGIKLVYSQPNKQDYLETVDAMAEKSGIEMEKEELHELALRWVLWHNARSGRTARQFIDDLKGRLELNC